VPVLLLSGGADPATPPRHAATVAKALPNSRHLIAPNLGHGISAQGCAPELIARFVRQASFEGIDGACLERLPAPPFFRAPSGDPR
jgi:pimeloyl-ACP methyl ester carboxylesterase